MISAENAYKTAERFNKKIIANASTTAEERIEYAICDAAQRGLFKVDVSLSDFKLKYPDRRRLLDQLIKERYSISFSPTTGTLTISWKNYLLR